MTYERKDSYENEVLECILRMVDVLESYRVKQDPWVLTDYLAVERALQVLIESFIGIARYVLKLKHGLALSKSGDAIDELLRNGMISLDSHKLFAQIIGYRNILVHDYLRLNPAITRAIVENGKYKIIPDEQKRLLDFLL
jgi:uncharacterized protein YutE (UPF0331/DUF86 family)